MVHKSRRTGAKTCSKPNRGLYFNGRGIAQFYQEAIECYQKAAKRDESIAESILVLMHFEGRGVAKSGEDALI